MELGLRPTLDFTGALGTTPSILTLSPPFIRQQRRVLLEWGRGGNRGEVGREGKVGFEALQSGHLKKNNPVQMRPWCDWAHLTQSDRLIDIVRRICEIVSSSMGSWVCKKLRSPGRLAVLVGGDEGVGGAGAHPSRRVLACITHTHHPTRLPTAIAVISLGNFPFLCGFPKGRGETGFLLNCLKKLHHRTNRSSTQTGKLLQSRKDRKLPFVLVSYWDGR